MTAQTATIADFLLARIAEDEKFARRAQGAYQHVGGIPHYFDPTPGEFPTPMVAMSPRTALAECEAKRRIVEDVAPHLDDVEGHAIDGGMYDDDRPHALHDLLRALAQPYADHPDWREEWRA